MWPKCTDAEPVDADVDPGRAVPAARECRVPCPSARRCRRTPRRSPRRAAPSGSSPACRSACRRPCRGCSRISSSSTCAGQAERRDVEAHQAAGLRELLEDHDLVAERHEIVGDGERRRTGADERDALAVLLRREPRAGGRECRRAGRPRRASGGRSRPACRRRVRAGRPARTGGRRCARGCRETRSTRGSACTRRCIGPARSAGCTPARWCGPDTPTGSRRPCGSIADRIRYSAPCYAFPRKALRGVSRERRVISRRVAGRFGLPFSGSARSFGSSSRLARRFKRAWELARPLHTLRRCGAGTGAQRASSGSWFSPRFRGPHAAVEHRSQMNVTAIFAALGALVVASPAFFIFGRRAGRSAELRRQAEAKSTAAGRGQARGRRRRARGGEPAQERGRLRARKS